MADTSRNHDWMRIEREIQGEGYQKLLRELGSRHQELGHFETWTDVLNFMRQGSSDDPIKDQILRIIFGIHRSDQKSHWRTILMAIFWPALISIHWQKRHWDSDLDERWQNIVWTFLKVICRLDPERRRERIVQKVFNDTVHDLHLEYRRRWANTAAEVSLDSKTVSDLAGKKDVDYEHIDQRLAEEKEIRRLQFHRDARRLNDEDYFLLIGTRVYGQSLATYAKNGGLKYQAAKKRRQRAELIIRKFEEENPAV